MCTYVSEMSFENSPKLKTHSSHFPMSSHSVAFLTGISKMDFF